MNHDYSFRNQIPAHKVALPIDQMTTTRPLFIGGATPCASVCPVDIGQVIQAERESLSEEEKRYQEESGANGVPSSFGAAERFIGRLENPPGAGVTDAGYNAVRDASVGLLTVFACRRLLGLHITTHALDVSDASPSGLLRALGAQLGDTSLLYFRMDGEPFAYIYKGYFVPVKDKERFRGALKAVPFFHCAEGTFDDILSATAADGDKLLYKQLLFAFLSKNLGARNVHGQKVGVGYNFILTYIVGEWNGAPYLPEAQSGLVPPTFWEQPTVTPEDAPAEQQPVMTAHPASEAEQFIIRCAEIGKMPDSGERKKALVTLLRSSEGVNASFVYCANQDDLINNPSSTTPELCDVRSTQPFLRVGDYLIPSPILTDNEKRLLGAFARVTEQGAIASVKPSVLQKIGADRYQLTEKGDWTV